MDKKYIDLFKTLVQATATSAEQVMDYDRAQNDEEGLKTATLMRDDYQELYDRINNEDYQLTKQDATKLLLGAMIQVSQLQDRLKNLEKALNGYQIDVIPKLQDIVDNTKTDEEAAIQANQKFVFNDNN